MKAAHLQRGEDAEMRSLEFLQNQGLKLLERNFKNRYGEIDLIMMDNKDLVFIEVRYRKNDLFGGALQSIDTKKQQKIRRCAQSYLQNTVSQQFLGCRFDVVAVSGHPPDFSIDWVPAAFE